MLTKKQLRLAILEVMTEVIDEAAVSAAGLTDGRRNMMSIRETVLQKLKQAREEVRK